MVVLLVFKFSFLNNQGLLFDGTVFAKFSVTPWIVQKFQLSLEAKTISQKEKHVPVRLNSVEIIRAH